MVSTKILFVVSYYYPYQSGVTQYVKRLAEGLAGRKHHVTVLTSRHVKDLPYEEVLNGVTVKRLPVLFRVSKGVFKPALLPTIRELSKNADIVNIHVPFPEVGLCTLASRCKNLVLTYHCDLELQFGLVEKLVERVYYSSLAFAAPRVTRIVVNDMDYAASSRVGSMKDKLVEIFPPIEPYQRKDSTAFRKKYGISDGEIVVGFLGRLVYEKGLEYLIKAVPLILAKMPNARFIIAGEGEEIAGGRRHSVKEELMKQSFPFGSKVLYPGFLPEEELEEFYSACNVFVLPSIAALESFGMVQAEAMLCGTPVVASDRPGVRVPVGKTGMGLLAAARDERALADAVVEVAGNCGRFIQPREKIATIFSTENTVARYEQLFLEVLGK